MPYFLSIIVKSTVSTSRNYSRPRPCRVLARPGREFLTVITMMILRNVSRRPPCRVLRSRPEGLAERKTKPKKKREAAAEGDFDLPKKRRVSQAGFVESAPLVLQQALGKAAEPGSSAFSLARRAAAACLCWPFDKRTSRNGYCTAKSRSRAGWGPLASLPRWCRPLPLEI